jgi:hypothetical protein
MLVAPLRPILRGLFNSGGSPASTPEWAQRQKLLPNAGEANALNGYRAAVSRDGTRAIVTAVLDNGGAGSDQGLAEVWLFTGGVWVFEASLSPATPQAGEWFGQSCGIDDDGTRIVIGSYQYDTGDANVGRFCVFKRTGTSWAEEASVTGNVAGQRIGAAVAINGDGSVIIAGSFVANSSAGIFKVYTRSGTTWTLGSSINGAVNDSMGQSVAVSQDGTLAVIGCSNTPAGGVSRGVVKTYTLSGGTATLSQTLEATGKANQDVLGVDVAISGDKSRIIAGAFGRSSNAGGAQIWAGGVGAYANEQFITAADPDPDDRFGYSVTMDDDGDTVIVCAYLDDEAAADAGAAYVFNRVGTTWTQTIKLMATDGNAGDGLALNNALSVTGDGLGFIAGAFSDDESASGAGAAYWFSLE